MNTKNIFYLMLLTILLSTTSLFAQKFVTSVAPKDASFLQVGELDLEKHFLSSGSTQSLSVTTNLSLQAKSNQAWCKPKVEGSIVTLEVTENTGNKGRAAEVSIFAKDNRSVRIAVNQMGKEPAVLTNEKSLEADQYTSKLSLTVSSNILFSFELPDWIHGPGVSPAIGSAKYEFTLDPIAENEVRNGNIVVKSEVDDVIVPVKQTHIGYPTFAVISDIHFGNSVGEGPLVKVPKALKNLTSHKHLDALFIVGDLTEGGGAAAYSQLVSVMSNPSNYTTPIDTIIYMMGNHDNYSTNAQTMYSEGLKPLNGGRNYPLDQYLIIKGYPFITISQRGTANTGDGLGSYPQAVQDTLSSWLARAASECPGKPIFVFTHVPPMYTFYSAWPGEGNASASTWSMPVLNPILNQYPQVVVFGGHSHYPLGDPRSIHQGVDPKSSKKNFFTGINTGSTTYSEIHVPSVAAGSHPAKYENITEGMILTVQGNGDVKVQCYDTYRNEEMHPDNPWLLKAPHDGSMFTYADKRDAADNVNALPLRDGLPAPVFADGAILSVGSTTENSVSVSFPQASDNDCVFRYRICVKNEEGKVVKEHFEFSQFYLNSSMPKSLTLTVNGLTPGTTYTAEVTAYDSYDNISSPLRSQNFTTQGGAARWILPQAFPETKVVGQWLFNASGISEVKAREGVSLSAFEGKSGNLNYVEVDGLPSVQVLNSEATAAQASYLTLEHKLPATNAGDTEVKDYCIVMDLKATLSTSYLPLLWSHVQASDADLFIKNAGCIGLAAGGLGYSPDGFVQVGWNRIVINAKMSENKLDFYCVYPDGSRKVFSKEISSSARFSLRTNSPTDIFRDNDNEDGDAHLAQYVLLDQPLTAAELDAILVPWGKK